MLSALKDKEFLKTLAFIAIPIALQNLVTYSVGLMDTVMLGIIGEVQISASSAANQLFFMLMILGFGISSGCNVLISQYWGKKDTASIRKVFGIAVKISVVISVLFTLIALFFPAFVMNIFTPDQAVIVEGIKYLKIMGYACIFTNLSGVMLLMLRPIGTVRIALLVSCVSLVVNTSLNWILIFGNMGAPAMGIEGAAIATLIARVCEFVITLIYFMFFEKKLHIKVKDLISHDVAMFKDFVSISLPVFVNEVLWSAGILTIAAIIGNISTGFLAANSIYSTVSQVLMVLVIGISNATSVIVGNTIGAEQYDKIMPRVKVLLGLSLVSGIVMGGGLFFTRPLILSIYNITPETYQLTMEIMAVGSVVVFFQSMAHTGLVGVLRGGGDSRFVLVVDTTFLWAISIPLGAFAGFYLGVSPVVVYAIIKSDEIMKTICALLRIFRSNWVRNVTR